MQSDGSYSVDSQIRSLPNYLEDDNRQVVFEEEKQYAALKNELIEV